MRLVATAEMEAAGLEYVDLVGAADVVVTKPGYGIVSDAIAAGTRMIYTDRGDFPEYPILVREMAALAGVRLRAATKPCSAARSRQRSKRVIARPMPAPPPLDGARHAADRILAAV